MSAVAIQLAGELLEAGAISLEEHDALIEASVLETLHDFAKATKREQSSPLPIATAGSNQTQPHQENAMNTRAIIKSIEDNRAVMEAQIEKLGQISTGAPHLTLTDGSMPDTVAGLLNAAVRGHLQGAATALNAIDEVEQQMRAALRPAAPTPPQRPSEIIDAEVIDPHTKK